jgi:hypothetical protein
VAETETGLGITLSNAILASGEVGFEFLHDSIETQAAMNSVVRIKDFVMDAGIT